VYRDTASPEVLQRAIACGEHLLKQARSGAAGMRTWVCTGAGNKALNGMSHGAAGFAFALAALFAATSDQRFAEAAQEAVAFENNSYNPDRKNWPDFRREGGWSVRWCHGAPGIGLARSAMATMSGVARPEWLKDIAHAAECTEISWTGDVDTLCCGSLGNIEFLRTAAAALDRDEVKRFAAKALIDVISSAREAGDYRWNGGPKKFNLGLFRGLAGVGYTCLRELKSDLPNVLVWE
jgi:lantibiotic modifying enzyme